MDRTVAALFPTPARAEEARRRLAEAGLGFEVRLMPLGPPPSAGAALAGGFARALADLGLGPAPAAPADHTLVLVRGDVEAALDLLETLAPLALDRHAERWSQGAGHEASAGLVGDASAAGTGSGPTSLNAAASGLTPGRMAGPDPGAALPPMDGGGPDRR
ncbi:MAG TPA: hypothetical protein VEA41_16870 [Salinarimonas sp.]|jgi:hypothetical protein|nr:hypothetical protein [Salinarimonas sp.]